jgi:hypothetical protein
VRPGCYDFLNFCAEKFAEKIGVFCSKQSEIMQKLDHNIGFLRKTPIFVAQTVTIFKYLILEKIQRCKSPT